MSRISDLPWIDKYAGVVKIIAKESEIPGKPQLFPVSCQITADECDSGRYKDLCPDSTKRSVVYLEDTGSRSTGVNTWSASIQLVAWLNQQLIGYNGCSYTGIAISGIVNKLAGNRINSGIYQNITFDVVGQQPVNFNPFQKFSYKGPQLMIFPFDYFTLNIDATFEINPNCITIPDLGAALGCLNIQPSADDELLDDWVEPYTYIGYAPKGTSQISLAWTIFQLQVFPDGTSVKKQSAANVRWADRYITTYS